ncbi:MAG: hypothetical protein WD737_03105 [Gemmatimonadota bacterium]
MLSHQFYNLVHIVGLVLLMSALGGMALSASSAASGGTRGSKGMRRVIFGLHGLGVFLVLLGGFGMMARLGIVQGTSWPGWVWVKTVVWGVLAVAAFLPYRFPRTALPLLLLLPVLGGLAAYMAIYKPL